MKLIKSRSGNATAEKSIDATASADELNDEVEVDAAETTDAAPAAERRRVGWASVAVYGLLPAIVLALGGAAGYLQWKDVSLAQADTAKKDSTKAATDATIALLSYKPETVEKDLEAAKKYMTGNFLNSYTSLTHDVVIPGSRQKKISAVATVPAAAWTKATPNHAVVMLFADQTMIIGESAPTSTASSVRVTLDKVEGRWLISQFDPM
ncbi:membrane protein [Mycolicibacterium llatzerense]|uniref:Membrane protein n=1 Tax=Mycolicibacterium llatzerense TaxID=280871 RepID=A0A0D1J2I3_9MYCO|nr:membrane protein [Mycolicibacterium llatzerense]KIU15773.1 membrane protein [Mycolicibacterium llatzerense]